jgi:hypothetical protein
MKKIAIVGDSHSVMLIDAWRDMKSNSPDVSVDFFSWFSGGEKSLIIRSGEVQLEFDSIKIVSSQNNILDVEDYDSILVCGLGYTIRKVLAIYKEFRTSSHADSNYLLSDNLFGLAVDSVVEQSVSYRLVKALNLLNCRSVFVSPVPMGSGYYLDDIEDPNLFKLCYNNKDNKDIYDKFTDTAQLFSREGGIVLSQPLHTIIDWIFTDNFYSNASDPIKSKKYTNSRGKRDLNHMNKEYGEIVLKDLLRNFDSN